eukprot:161309-Prorocentrum_minimum.AAC.1
MWRTVGLPALGGSSLSPSPNLVKPSNGVKTSSYGGVTNWGAAAKPNYTGGGSAYGGGGGGALNGSAIAAAAANDLRDLSRVEEAARRVEQVLSHSKPL